MTDVLFGDQKFTGKLRYNWPRNMEDRLTIHLVLCRFSEWVMGWIRGGTAKYAKIFEGI